MLNYLEAENITNKELLELYVKILMSASLENIILRKTSKMLNPGTEMANGPTRVEGKLLSYSQGEFMVSPISSAREAEVIGSYFEMVQNQSGTQWEEKKV